MAVNRAWGSTGLMLVFFTSFSCEMLILQKQKKQENNHEKTRKVAKARGKRKVIGLGKGNEMIFEFEQVQRWLFNVL